MQKRPEPTPTPSPALSAQQDRAPIEEQTHTKRKNLHQREKCVRRIHSDGDGEGGVVLCQRDGERRYLEDPSHPQLIFSISSQSWFVSCHPGVLRTSLYYLTPFLKPCLNQASPSSIMFCSPGGWGRGTEASVCGSERIKLGRPRPEAVTVGESGADRTLAPLGAHICMGNSG